MAHRFQSLAVEERGDETLQRSSPVRIILDTYPATQHLTIVSAPS
jgi:hypothetical protein